jgi:hypothetical protein
MAATKRPLLRSRPPHVRIRILRTRRVASRTTRRYRRVHHSTSSSLTAGSDGRVVKPASCERQQAQCRSRAAGTGGPASPLVARRHSGRIVASLRSRRATPAALAGATRGRPTLAVLTDDSGRPYGSDARFDAAADGAAGTAATGVKSRDAAARRTASAVCHLSCCKGQTAFELDGGPRSRRESPTRREGRARRRPGSVVTPKKRDAAACS